MPANMVGRANAATMTVRQTRREKVIFFMVFYLLVCVGELVGEQARRQVSDNGFPLTYGS
jgi:hypothetical protein